MNSFEKQEEIPFRERAVAFIRMLGGLSIGFSHSISNGTNRLYIEPTFLNFDEKILDQDNEASFDVCAYEEILRATSFWHGTGRYYTTWENQKVDVLEGILSEGGLRASLDTTDHRIGPVGIVAATPYRMLARIYADSHANNLKSQSRYGDSSFWLGVFAGRIAHEMFTKGELGNFVTHSIRVGIKTKKLRQPHVQKESVMNAQGLLRGSHIANNYPIIIGFNSSALNPTIKHRQEVRFSEVPLVYFTQFQVPKDKVDELKIMLENQGLIIPVIPLEEAEAYDASRTLSCLLN